jgi:hypothetical protein
MPLGLASWFLVPSAEGVIFRDGAGVYALEWSYTVKASRRGSSLGIFVSEVSEICLGTL